MGADLVARDASTSRPAGARKSSRPTRPRAGNIDVEIASGIATVTIDRARVRNALDRDTIGALGNALADLGARSDVGAVVITGAGRRAFVAGRDIAEMRNSGSGEALAGITSGLCSTIERLSKPTIAAVNGYALGGGCELALACDLRVAARNAVFGLPETGLGIIPAAGGTQRLPRVIGLGRAKQMILTGESVGAETALAWGLVNAVVPANRLLATAHQLATRLLTRGPLAVHLAKLAMDASARVDLDSGLLVERLAQALCYGSPDHREGTTAFIEKRAPQFRP